MASSPVEAEGAIGQVVARRVLLATGATDVEPRSPTCRCGRRGLVRHCPICDGFEGSGKRIAVIGSGDRGLGEAVFVARTYSREVTRRRSARAWTLTRTSVEGS